MFPTTMSPVLIPIPMSIDVLAFGVPLRLQFLQLLDHGKGASACAFGMVGLADGRSPERHDGVAHELVERAFMLEHDLRHGPQILVQQGHHFFGLVLLGKGREAADIGEEHGDLLAVAAELCLARVPDQFVHDALGHIAREHLPDVPCAALFGKEAVGGLARIAEEERRRGIDEVEPDPLGPRTGNRRTPQ